MALRPLQLPTSAVARYFGSLGIRPANWRAAETRLPTPDERMVVTVVPIAGSAWSARDARPLAQVASQLEIACTFRVSAGPTSYEYVSSPGGHGTSANDRPESAFRVLPERRVEFRRRQIEHGVVGLVHARDDERVQKATNAGGSPAALDVVEHDLSECVVQTGVCESAAAGQLREGRDVTRGDEFAHQTLVVIRPRTYHVAGNAFLNPARHSAVSAPPRQDDFTHEEMGQLVDDQRVELRIAFGEWEHDAASVRSRWCDFVAGCVRRNLSSRHWTRRCKHHQRHFGDEDEVQTPADSVVRTLGGSNDTVEFRCERRQVVDFEVLAFGPPPR
jgi:hypothetical protein